MLNKFRIGKMVFILLFVGCNLFKKKESYLLLSEVIPGADIISETECIIEYRGNIFILGPGDFRKKRDLIYELDLVNIPGPVEIDLRYRRQVIIRKR